MNQPTLDRAVLRSADCAQAIVRRASATANGADEPRGVKQRHPAHATLFMEGDPSGKMFEVVEGAVMLYKLLPDGRRQLVELLGPGELFGMSPLASFDCSAETLIPATVLSYERRDVEMSPELQRRLVVSLTRKLQGMHDHAVTLGCKSALERVTSFLMLCVPDRGGPECVGRAGSGSDQAKIRLAVTRQEIADYLGLTIETVSRAFTELRRRGAISLDRQDEVRIHNVCGLCHLTGAH